MIDDVSNTEQDKRGRQVVLHTLSGKKIHATRWSSSSRSLFPPAWPFTESFRLRLDSLEHLLKVVDRELLDSQRYVEKNLQDPRNEEMAEFFLEDIWTHEDLCGEAERLAAVGLYSRLEQTVRLILSWVYGKEIVASENLYKWDKLKRRLELDFKIDLMKIRGVKAADELRCLSNSVKHEGRVNRDLSQFRGWRKGGEIKRVNRRNFKRMESGAKAFLKYFHVKLGKAVDKLYRKQSKL